MIDEYDYLPCPGSTGLLIPVVKRSKTEDETTGTRVPDWMFFIEDGNTESTIDKFESYCELFGWYCESSRHVQGDSAGHLSTSGTLWHSNVYLVCQNGKHTTFIQNSAATGRITTKVSIVRLIRINNVVHEQQRIDFLTCHWVGVHTLMSHSICVFTACERTNTVKGFNQAGPQMGNPAGQTSCTIKYLENRVA